MRSLIGCDIRTYRANTCSPRKTVRIAPVVTWIKSD